MGASVEGRASLVNASVEGRAVGVGASVDGKASGVGAPSEPNDCKYSKASLAPGTSYCLRGIGDMIKVVDVMICMCTRRKKVVLYFDKNCCFVNKRCTNCGFDGKRSWNCCFDDKRSLEKYEMVVVLTRRFKRVSSIDFVGRANPFSAQSAELRDMMTAKHRLTLEELYQKS